MQLRILLNIRNRLAPRAVFALACYAGILVISFYLAYELRFDFSVPREFRNERLDLIGYVVLGKLVFLILSRQLGSVQRYFSTPDLMRLAFALGAAGLVLFATRWLNGGRYLVPRSVVLVDFMLSMAGLCAYRLTLRLLQQRLVLARRFPIKKLERIAIVGAGDTGASLASDLISMPARGLKPIAFFDDDPRKSGTRIHGVEVVGVPEALPKSDAADVTTVVVAMPSAPQKRIREIVLFLVQRGYKVETVPALEDLASGRAKVSRTRPVEVADLLGREAVELDAGSISKFVENRVVLVTGAGGSIGSEICRQVAALNPRKLLMLDQSEPALFLVEQELNSLGYGGVTTALIADVLDTERLNVLFDLHRPVVVFHAAAHKHVYMMERQPSEAVKNNAIGTRKLAEVAMANGTEAFVLISTDKAVNPTNAMGASKRLAELHLQALHTSIERGDGGAAQTVGDAAGVIVKSLKPASSIIAGAATSTRVASEVARVSVASPVALGAPPHSLSKDGVRTKLMAVRFGNVLGSSGSVVPIFKRQIEAGGPVTVTHPDVTRYFMTIPEAVGLVLQASAFGKGGEIFVLDMGQPIKIVDLAKQMIELSGYTVGEDIEIVYSGLKPGEKLFEELQHHTEQYQPTQHPRIKRFVSGVNTSEASRMAIRELEPFVDEMAPADIKRALKMVIPEYEPFLE